MDPPMTPLVIKVEDVTPPCTPPPSTSTLPSYNLRAHLEASLTARQNNLNIVKSNTKDKDKDDDDKDNSELTSNDKESPLVPSNIPIPSVEALMELLVLVTEECQLNDNVDDGYCKAFLQRNTEVASLFQSREKLKLENFDIKQKIGEGTTSDLYMAVLESDTNHACVIKLMEKSTLLSKPDSICYWEERDFLVKAANAALRHPVGLPGIIELSFAFHSARYVCLVTDFYPGGDMCALCDKLESFSEDMVKFYIAECILALETVHSLGYVHRDFKPDNVFLDARGHLWLGDFGSCAKLEGTKVPKSRRAQAFNSPEYIAPELMLAMHGDTTVEYGAECDWWSLGVVM